LLPVGIVQQASAFTEYCRANVSEMPEVPPVIGAWRRNRVALAGCVGGPRLRSAVVPLTAIIVHVMRPGRRADELLAAVAEHLGRGTQIPDERGHVRILLEESEGAAWQRVHDALDAAGDDWHEHLHVSPRPG
jgi:hypothetical protein